MNDALGMYDNVDIFGFNVKQPFSLITSNPLFISSRIDELLLFPIFQIEGVARLLPLGCFLFMLCFPKKGLRSR